MHSSEMSTPAGPALNQIIKSLGDEGIECKGESGVRESWKDKWGFEWHVRSLQFVYGKCEIIEGF